MKVSNLPNSVSIVDMGMVTLFPVSLSLTVRPVIVPSSGNSLERSHDAKRPPSTFHHTHGIRLVAPVMKKLEEDKTAGRRKRTKHLSKTAYFIRIDYITF